MSAWLTADEDDRMHELPWLAQLIYLRVLRRFFDRRGGVVGLTRRLSYRAIVETMTVPGRRGRHSSCEAAPTTSAVRHALAELARVGLIERLAGPDEALVFRLPRLLQGQSVRRMSDTMSDTMSDRGQSGGFGNTLNELRSAEAPMNDSMSVAMSDTHLLKAIPLGSSLSADRSTQRARSEVVELATRLRREAGMLDAHPQRPELIALIDYGVGVDAVVETAKELRERRGEVRVGYLAATVRGRLADMTRGQVYGNAVSGGGRRASVCDEIERQDREATARERRECMRIV